MSCICVKLSKMTNYYSGRIALAKFNIADAKSRFPMLHGRSADAVSQLP